jgi:hypothetical protein
MIRRLTSRLTYANVTSTLALFVALGGSSYGALNLPRNSVGSKQIRTAAVGSRQIKDSSLEVKDLSVAARKAMRGAAGPAGPAGPTGPAGISATRYFAVVSSSGKLLAGNATSGGSGQSTGTSSSASPNRLPDAPTR